MYVIRSLDNDAKYYIGYTTDLKNRIKSHNSGLNTYTSHNKWQLVYYEAYVNEKAARLRERKLKKHGRVKQLLLKRISESLE